jgi:hypothetical protein
MTMPADHLDLDRLAALENAATAGPWVSRRLDECRFAIGQNPIGRTAVITSQGNDEANGDLIAAARNALPALLRELREARAALAARESQGGGGA